MGTLGQLLDLNTCEWSEFHPWLGVHTWGLCVGWQNLSKSHEIVCILKVYTEWDWKHVRQCWRFIWILQDMCLFDIGEVGTLISAWVSDILGFAMKIIHGWLVPGQHWGYLEGTRGWVLGSDQGKGWLLVLVWGARNVPLAKILRKMDNNTKLYKAWLQLFLAIVTCIFRTVSPAKFAHVLRYFCDHEPLTW